MKKIFILIIFVICLSGCTKLDIDNYDDIVNKFLYKETSLVNNYMIGYKYYLPSGVNVLSSDNFNDILEYNGDKYYLYADIVSYFYKTNVEYSVNNDHYYFKKLEYNGKIGYIVIDKVDDKYKIEFYYNYGRVETTVSKDNISDALINISYILNSLTFNDSVVNSYLGEEAINFSEEVYDFYTPKTEGSFIDYVEVTSEDDEEEKTIGNTVKDEEG